jgi:TrkA domain protein
MSTINETHLPGVGIRHDFATEEGESLGVIVHHNGRRDLLVYDQDDPDSCRYVIRMSERDANTLSQALGVEDQVTEQIHAVQQNVAGLTIDWLPITDQWVCAGNTIGEFAVFARTGVFIVAIVRDGVVTPTPPSDYRLQSGDVAVVVGPPEGIRETFQVLEGL